MLGVPRRGLVENNNLSQDHRSCFEICVGCSPGAHVMSCVDVRSCSCRTDVLCRLAWIRCACGDPSMPDAQALAEVVRAGWYGQSGHCRQRWWCRGSGERHRFTEVVPRIVDATDIHAKRHRTDVRVAPSPVVCVVVHIRDAKRTSAVSEESRWPRPERSGSPSAPSAPETHARCACRVYRVPRTAGWCTW